MMEIIPTWEVILDPDDDNSRQRWRVSQDNLKAFLDVVLFNDVGDVRMIREDVLCLRGRPSPVAAAVREDTA